MDALFSPNADVKILAWIILGYAAIQYLNILDKIKPICFSTSGPPWKIPHYLTFRLTAIAKQPVFATIFSVLLLRPLLARRLHLVVDGAVERAANRFLGHQAFLVSQQPVGEAPL